MRWGSATRASPAKCKIAFLALSRIANFDDLDPLKLEPGVDLVMVRPGEAIPGDARLVIIPGSKSTRGDLAFLRAQGWDIDLLAHHRRGGHVLGLCGGYQMLGHSVADPEGIEGPAGETQGLGLLDVTTVMTEQKTLTRVDRASMRRRINRSMPMKFISAVPTGRIVHGHLRCSTARRKARSRATDVSRAAICTACLRPTISARRSSRSSTFRQQTSRITHRVESALDALADHIEAHLDVEGLLALAR